MIFAWNDHKPASCDSQPAQHPPAQRGTRSLRLDEADPHTAPIEVDGETIKEYVVRFDNTETSGPRTRYWWSAHRAPFDEPVHIIGYETIVPSAELAQAHHMLLYVCPEELSDAELALVGDKHSAGMEVLEKCNFVEPIAAWAVGGDPFYLPPDAGISLGGLNHRSSLLLEAHLDVVNEQPHITSIGFRLLYTETRRPREAGILVFGTNVDAFLVAPPGEITSHTGYCFSACTEAAVPSEGITIISSMLHMHTLGSQMGTRIVRANGVEEKPLDWDPHYDFNFQASNELHEHRTIYPGDQLVTTCTFDATRRLEPTFGGESTSEEMCLHYVVAIFNGQQRSPQPRLGFCASTGTDALVADLVDRGAFGAGNAPQPDEDLQQFLGRVPLAKLNSAWREADAAGTSRYKAICMTTESEFLLPLNENENSHAPVKPAVAYVAPELCERYERQEASLPTNAASCLAEAAVEEGSASAGSLRGAITAALVVAGVALLALSVALYLVFRRSRRPSWNRMDSTNENENTEFL